MAENTMNTEQQAGTPNPKETGGAGRMFTQEEVNRIVSERLQRERERAQQQADADKREQALMKREQALKAKEAWFAKEQAARDYYMSQNISGKALYIALRGSGHEIDALDLDENGRPKDTGALDKLIGGVFSGLVTKTITIGADTPHLPVVSRHAPDDILGEAITPKI